MAAVAFMIDFRGHTGFSGDASVNVHNTVAEAAAGVGSAVAAMPGMVAGLPPVRITPALSVKFSKAAETAGARPRTDIDRARCLGRGAPLSLRPGTCRHVCDAGRAAKPGASAD